MSTRINFFALVISKLDHGTVIEITNILVIIISFKILCEWIVLGTELILRFLA